MKIAQIAPLYEAVPPKLYGGTERVVAYLCDALVEQGHEVTLFASAEAHTSARLVSMRDQAIRLDDAPLTSDLAAHLAMLHDVRGRASQFDILHFHIDMLHFPLFSDMADRCVTTMHGRLDLKDLPAVYRHWPGFGLVSISNSQRRPMPAVNWLATVPHGLPRSLCTLTQQPEGYLAFLGRISPEKRPDVAIHIAQRTGIALKIAAKVDAVDHEYFRNVIEPLLDDPLVEYIGEIGDRDKSGFLGGARALLFPIAWPEPFGLVMIEAFACGTPVIAWNCGSVPEIVQDGHTGYIVNDEAEAVHALSRISRLNRREIRAAFERRFTADAMASAYLDVYATLLGRRPVRRVS